MGDMSRFVILLALTFALGAAPARAEVVRATAPAVVDVSFPFACDWGYDWDERCYRDDSSRLLLGGAGDKVWRAGVRFDLSRLPRGLRVLDAQVWLRYDGTCSGPCAFGWYELLAHQLRGPWFSEREPDYEWDPLAWAELEPFEGPAWVAFEVGPLVAAWLTGETPNDGVLVRLGDGQETLDGAGPRFASASEPDLSLSPRLEVRFLR